MTDIEFVLSLTPEQIFKFVELNNKKEFVVEIINNPDNFSYNLLLCDSIKGYKINYEWFTKLN